jgi:hypothetical protein
MVDGLIWDQVGQLGESEKYWMKMMRVIYFHIWSSEGGSSRLCRLRIDRLAPLSKIDYVMTSTRLWGPANLAASMVAELDDTPPYLMDDVGIVWGTPTDVRRCIACKTCTRVWWV